MGATAAIAAVAGGTALSATGKYQSGQYAKKVMGYNASVADLQAQDALERGAVLEQRRRVGTRQLIGAERTSLAAQNVVVGQGSAASVEGSAAYIGELDALTIRNNAMREAWGYQVQAYDYRRRGKFAAAEGTMGAISTILGGAGSLLSGKYGMGGTPLSPAEIPFSQG
jgi:hypothetical protein